MIEAQTSGANNTDRSGPPAFHVMIKGGGSRCNLDCRYCYYLSKERLYPGGTFRMSDELLERFTRQYIEAQPGPEVTFSWQGGEPALLGLNFYERALAYQQKYRRPEMVIRNAFQTNGILLDRAWAEFFARNRFLVGVSLDGPPEMHDAYRVDPRGAPTHARVMRGIAALREHGVEYNILCCVHRANADHPVEVYRYLRDVAGAGFIQFIPVVEHDGPAGSRESFRVTRRSVGGRKYGEFLIGVFDEWIAGDVGRVFVQIFDAALAAWCGARPGICIFEETCGLALVLEHNGDLYACDHYVEPGHLLGNLGDANLADLAGSQAQIRFGRAKLAGLPRYCLDCDVRFICQGECPKNRIRRTPAGEPGLSYLCAGYKAFFTHIARPMSRMRARIMGG